MPFADIGTIEASTSVENGIMTDRSATSRYLVSLFMSICVFAVVNCFKYPQQAPCADCFATYGWPFPFVELGGLVTVHRFLWQGVACDVAFVLVISAAIAWAWKRIVSR